MALAWLSFAGEPGKRCFFWKQKHLSKRLQSMNDESTAGGRFFIRLHPFIQVRLTMLILSFLLRPYRPRQELDTALLHSPPPQVMLWAMTGSG